MIDNRAGERNRMRQLALARRDAIPAEQRSKESKQIVTSLLSLPLFQKAQNFFIYCHYHSEVETSQLCESCLDQGKRLSVPLCQPGQASMLAVVIADRVRDLSPGYKGILEPKSSLIEGRVLAPTAIEVAVIPGVVFDRRGHRLGYGGGFYDRFLARLAPQAIRIGLAFTTQLVDRIPTLPHDVPMDMVIGGDCVLTWPRSIAANSGL